MQRCSIFPSSLFLFLSFLFFVFALFRAPHQTTRLQHDESNFESLCVSQRHEWHFLRHIPMLCQCLATAATSIARLSVVISNPFRGIVMTCQRTSFAGIKTFSLTSARWLITNTTSCDYTHETKHGHSFYVLCSMKLLLETEMSFQILLCASKRKIEKKHAAMSNDIFARSIFPLWKYLDASWAWEANRLLSNLNRSRSNLNHNTHTVCCRTTNCFTLSHVLPLSHSLLYSHIVFLPGMEKSWI